MANMVKSLILHGRVQTTLAKAKCLRSYADKMITLAKKGTLSARRSAIAELMICFNQLTPKEQRAARSGDLSAYNGDRRVIAHLFDTLAPRFASREGGYTRIVRAGHRVGDASPICYVEYLSD